MPKSVRKKLKSLKSLKGEDKDRMARLFEEITGKVQEMSTIMNRLHGTPVQWSHFRISSSGASEADGPFVLIVVCNEETGECGCYDHEAGTCGPCPDLN
ncbi:hypothetical protein [Nitrosovibrio sp. Nv4]|uniref:hypothetical protein n=1 Tax=Nitrosovibrio sp. Nv4 TaxID=1945880 RepID=UPI000BCD597E|nr:hypothetical protein [Nitrosovibrio sp. Nv4]SOD41464.1 hypothetical protein SAMN06298226_1759 [Nitrosovibrio sp. Nv4]